MSIQKVTKALKRVLERAKRFGRGCYRGIRDLMKQAGNDWSSVILLLMATIGGITVMSMLCSFLGIPSIGAESLFVLSLISTACVAALASV